jgi:hypothetical protein
MSYEAVAFVKQMRVHSDGTPLTRCEKLVLLILADYYNLNFGYAMPGLTAIARDALISRRYVIKLLGRLKEHGTIEITTRLHNSNLYRLTGFKHSDRKKGGEQSALVNAVHLVKSVVRGSELASSPKPEENRKPKTPLPPTCVGGSEDASSSNGNRQYISWGGELISVEMGRHKRIPPLDAYDGARAGDVVNFLLRRGFSARIEPGQ